MCPQLELRKFVTPEFIFGDGARLFAGRYAENLAARKILIVTDPGIKKTGMLDEICGILNNRNLEYEIFSNVTPNPRDKEVIEGAEVFSNEECNLIIALGGGSPMDCAKGIGIVSSNKKHILDFKGVDKVPAPSPPLICIPTTAGSSADVSQFAIILDTQKKLKIAIISKALVPDVALIDPSATLTMDKYLTASSALDALVHSIEAYTSNASSQITDLHALDSIKLISNNLEPLLNDLQNLNLRSEMMMGSLEAGLAFSNASLGLIHAMAHSLGGLLDLSHGLTDCNKSACDQLGYSQDELIKKPLLDLVDHKNQDNFKKIFSKTPPKKPWQFEAHFIKKDTKKIPMEVSARTVKFSGVLYSVMVARDIGDRITAQKFIHPKELLKILKYHQMRRNNIELAPKEYEIRGFDKYGDLKYLVATVALIPGTEKILVSLMDISARKAAEEQLRSSLDEKNVLLKEIHHRVKNNLQIISSLLNLQSYHVRDPQDMEIFKESQGRIKSMAIIHEQLYQSKNLSSINLADYIQNIMTHLFHSYSCPEKKIILELNLYYNRNYYMLKIRFYNYGKI